MIFGGAEVVPDTEIVAETPVPSITEGLEVAPIGDSPRNGSLAEVAGAALVEAGVLEGGELEVIVRSSSAQLSGTVETHAQMLRAAEVVQQVSGIESVGTGGVIILAQRDGATHVVASGETLGEIAYNYYGKSSHYQLILDENSFLNGKTTLKIGQTLTLPSMPDET
jgi:LysM repeat protein